jgi:HEPN domain-containing protein
LPLSFSKSLRISIVRILDRFSDWGGWENSENLTSDSAAEDLKTFYGQDDLVSFDNSNRRVPCDFSALIRNGYPSEVLDAIEAWFDQKHLGKEKNCELDINNLLGMNHSPWRFVNGEAYLVDSEYLHQEVQARTLRLLQEGRAFGSLEEFQGAVRDLQSGEYKDAVVKAHKSVESVMKTAMGIDAHITFGALLAKLIKSGLVPEYYEEFLVHFEKLALGAVKERNRPGTGHGQGVESREVPKGLAEFSVNLAGSINLFIIQQWIESRPEEPER